MKQRVLLIDDDKLYGQSLARNFTVYTTYSLKQIEDSRLWREELERYQPNFVLLDLDMPKHMLNGLEVAQAIQADPKHAKTKIMLLTGMRLKFENDAKLGLYQGFDCISKEDLKVEDLAKLISDKIKTANQAA